MMAGKRIPGAIWPRRFVPGFCLAIAVLLPPAHLFAVSSVMESTLEVERVRFAPQTNTLVLFGRNFGSDPFTGRVYLHIPGTGYVTLPALGIDAAQQQLSVELPDNIAKFAGPYRVTVATSSASVSFELQQLPTEATGISPVLGTSGQATEHAFSPLWRTGQRYDTVFGRTQFQGVPDHIGGFAYNIEEQPGDITLGLSFESRYQNLPAGVDTEHYFYWMSADRKASRRIYQSNISWGKAGGEAVTKPAGWTRWSYDVNRFGIGNGSLFTDNFSIDLDAEPHQLKFDGSAVFGAGLTVAGDINVRGTKQNLISGSTAFYTPNLVQTGPDPLFRITPLSGDSGVEFDRTPDRSEYLRIGAGADGNLFGGVTNRYLIDIVGSAENRLRAIVARRSADQGRTFEEFLRLDPGTRRLAIGEGIARAHDAGATLFVGGSMNINSGTNVVRILHGVATLAEGKATVSAPMVTVNSRIFLTVQVPSGGIGMPYTSKRSPTSSFEISSTSPTDNSVVAWLLIEP
jgi:hypothetical protein